MQSWIVNMLSALVAILLATSPVFAQLEPVFTNSQSEIDFFENSVRPIFAVECASCHGDQLQMADLNLTTAEGFFKGSSRGAIVDPERPAESVLLQVVGHQGKVKMPPTGPLSPENISALGKWVEMGAPWPSDDSAAVVAPSDGARPGLWAFQPVKDHAPPNVIDQDWVRTPIDRFILARLEDKGVRPSAPAEKLQLLRRAKFDLHGLPPSEQEIEEFLSDTAPEAMARLVDRLLASPRYGEKWGRHWLDVARYADSTGLDEDYRLPHSWRYRDYVVDAFNRDLPFDQFVREQLAGDLMPADEPGEINTRGIIATGFLALGVKPLAQQDKMQVVYDVVDEQLDTVSKAFMGMTVTCARCHDHKFDPISTKDYYSMASIFASTKSFEDAESFVSEVYFAPLVDPRIYEVYRKEQERLKARRYSIESIRDLGVADYVQRTLIPRLPDYMIAARQVLEDRVPLSNAATQADLDEGVLQAWIEYLKPGQFRPYLEKWERAKPSEWLAAAEEYRELYATTSQWWSTELKSWGAMAEEAIRAGDDAPDKPAFDRGGMELEGRFFLEVSSGEGPFSVAKEDRESVLSDDVRTRLTSLSEELEVWTKAAPPEPPLACAVAEGEPVDQSVFVGGSHKNPGETVPKHFPVALRGAWQLPIESGSGRKELAEWLASPDHPLTARVYVNRVWQWHFGEGLVRSSNNFGSTGEQPTHAELLDYLAKRFVESGWSTKALHRMIMLSSAYQMSSQSSEAVNEADPESRLWSHFLRRRLTVEEMRDSLLALDGSLDLTMGGRIDDGLKKDEYGPDATFNPDSVSRRTLYLPLVRNKLPSLYRLFDFADAGASSGRRNESNIAPQALYAMNSDFLKSRAYALAEIVVRGSEDDSERLERAYRLILGRAPGGGAEPGIEYVRNYPAGDAKGEGTHLAGWASLCRILMASNEFHYVD